MSASLDILRDRNAPTAEFRRAVKRVCDHLMRKAGNIMLERKVDPESIIAVIILRAAVAFLPAAAREFPGAPVGIMGLKRDERTLRPRWYYENLPPISKKNVVILLDPMLATGGSADAAVKKLVERGADPRKIVFIGIVAAPEGVSRLAQQIPKENIILASVDSGLDEHGMIVPGIGDLGDRYFGYEGRAIIG